MGVYQTSPADVVETGTINWYRRPHRREIADPAIGRTILLRRDLLVSFSTTDELPLVGIGCPVSIEDELPSPSGYWTIGNPYVPIDRISGWAIYERASRDD